MSEEITASGVLAEIGQLLTETVRLSLSETQNFPSTRGDQKGGFEITVANASELSIALKNVTYDDIYQKIDEARAYNLKMVDGALIVLRYRFFKDEIVEHSLAYFPSPFLAEFQNDPDLYLDQSEYDVIDRNVVPFPIRFDFCSDPTKFDAIRHPYSHLTLGQYKSCRIPVCSPAGPMTFGGFILRNFYNTPSRKYSDELKGDPMVFPKTIAKIETSIPHVVLRA